MAVHYPKNFIGRCRLAKLVPVTIDVGGGICWQGGITVDEQMKLLAIMQDLSAKHPEDKLPPPKTRDVAEPSANGTPTHDRPATGIPAAQPGPAGKPAGKPK
jgi:hypothetical protein